MEEYLTYITNIVDDVDANPRPEGHAAALQHHALARPRGARGDGARRLSRHGAGARRQRRLYADPERRLRQHRAGLDPRLLRPAPDPRRQPGAVRASRDARAARHRGLRPARCRPVGIAHQGGRAHLSERDVLGGLRPARQDRPGHGPRRTAPTYWRARPTGCTRSSTSRPTTRRRAPSSRPSAATDLDATLLLLAEIDFVQAGRSALHRHRRGGRAEAAARRSSHAL